MYIKQINEQLDKFLKEDYKYSNEYVDNILSFSDKEELINSEKDFEDFLCYKDGKGYCVVSITFEYETPQINFQTEWFNTKEEALNSYKQEFLNESRQGMVFNSKDTEFLKNLIIEFGSEATLKNILEQIKNKQTVLQQKK